MDAINGFFEWFKQVFAWILEGVDSIKDFLAAIEQGEEGKYAPDAE